MLKGQLLRNLLLIVPTIWGVTLFVFLLIRLIPGDAVIAKIGESGRLGPAEIQQIRDELGLSDPIHIQYVRWLGGAVTGDFGRSFESGQPVFDIALRRAPVSLEIAFLAIVFSLLVGLPLGLVSAVRQDSVADHLLRVFSIAALSVPNFVLATLFILLTSTWFRWLPPIGYRSVVENPGDHFQQVLPAVVIVGFAVAGLTMRMTRSSMLNVLRDDFVRTARSKGLRELIVVVRHVLPNALIPVVSLTSTSFALLLGGVVIVETIFALPGLGSLTVTAIAARDYPQIMVNVLLLSVGVVSVNLLTDLIYSRLDPRIRVS
jgi:peptide/nickel transport system permease protein